MAKEGWRRPSRHHARLRLSKLCPDPINLFPVDSQPFQEPLVRIRMAALKNPVPLVHFRLVQADLLEHGYPFIYVHVLFHTLRFSLI